MAKRLEGNDRRFGYEFGVDGVVTLKEAAALLGVTIRTVRLYCQRGQLRRGNQAGRGRVICKRSIEALRKPVEL